MQGLYTQGSCEKRQLLSLHQSYISSIETIPGSSPPGVLLFHWLPLCFARFSCRHFAEASRRTTILGCISVVSELESRRWQTKARSRPPKTQGVWKHCGGARPTSHGNWRHCRPMYSASLSKCVASSISLVQGIHPIRYVESQSRRWLLGGDVVWALDGLGADIPIPFPIIPKHRRNRNCKGNSNHWNLKKKKRK
ncbi:hypothetical protein MA16_Dca027571 [Dendrobium catenatum]|uniref:Uncharacterized protein n=1 Tax=Dendrobium catenatum TaxID=906689 RepID=A0A2I0XA80_9ASPA|nr:hypothetical protein MA16_Dca027571 [Dendrobium catenatum]